MSGHSYNPKWKRYDRWLVQTYINFNNYAESCLGWRVTGPSSMTSDYVEVKYFRTHAEALEYANREWLRRELIDQFTNYLEENQNQTFAKNLDHTGLDTMFRLFRWWGKFDLADLLENI